MNLLSQILAVVIFVVMFVEIVREKRPRYIVTLCAGALTLIVVFLGLMHSWAAVEEALSFGSMATTTFWYTGHAAVNEMNTGINWSTIIFISGMMIMVEGMSGAGFFDWLCLRLARLVNYRPVPLLVCFMILSAVLSMFIDSITVILFLAVASVQLARLLKFDPVPLIIAEIFTANLGGAATMSGDPPNIIIGTALGLTFGDFLQNTGLIVLVSMVVIVPFFYFAFRKQVATQDEATRQKAMEMDPKASIHSWRKFVLNVGVFLLTVVLLITHAKTGLTVAMVGVIAAVLTLLVAYPGEFELEAMAQGIAHITGGSLTLMVIIILWLSGIASAFVDNIPFAATMVPVITSLSATMGVDLNALAWTLSMGTDIGGSGTPIGASANVAGTAIAAREGYAIGWGRYCKYSAPAAVIVLAISMVMLLLRY